MLPGGVARNRGVVEALQEKLGESIFVCEESQLCGAIGAALIALEGRLEQSSAKVSVSPELCGISR